MSSQSSFSDGWRITGSDKMPAWNKAEDGHIRFKTVHESIEYNSDMSPQAGLDWILEVAFKPENFNIRSYGNSIFSQHGNGTGWELRAADKFVELVFTTRKKGGRVNHNAFPVQLETGPQIGKWTHCLIFFDHLTSTLSVFVDGKGPHTKQVHGEFVGERRLPRLGQNPFWEDRGFVGEVAFARIEHVQLPTDITVFAAYLAGQRFAVIQTMSSHSSTQPAQKTFVYTGQDVPKDVTHIEFDSSVTSIEVWAFSKCSSLSSITIPTSITSIGLRAFHRCTSLSSITIPTSITSIEKYTFNNCTALSSITMPTSVTSIGEGAFYGCTSLSSITIPTSITSIGDRAFQGCTSLSSITIPTAVTSIETYTFSGCTSLASITIPTSITSIGKRAFEGCTLLCIIAIPPTATIHEDAFLRCTLLEEAAKKNNMDINAFVKKRFDDLPLHSICYNSKVSCEDIVSAIRTNKGCLTKTDSMGTTALHLLAANYSITFETAKMIHENHTDAIATKDIYGMYPLHYLSMNSRATVELFKEFRGWHPNALTIANNKGHLPLALALLSNLPQDALDYLFTCHPIEKRGVKGEEKLSSIAKIFISSIYDNPPTKKEKQHGWVRFVSTEAIVDLYEDARRDIKKLISDSNIENVKLLAYAKDFSGRSAMEIALPEIKTALQEKLLFLSRYELVKGPPIHISATCVVVKAEDFKMEEYYESTFHAHVSDNSKLMDKATFSNALKALSLVSESDEDTALQDKYFKQVDTDNSGTISLEEFVSFCVEEFGRSVALKFMRNKDQFQREMDQRDLLSNSKHVVSILRAHDSTGTIIPSKNETKPVGMVKLGYLESHLTDYLSHGNTEEQSNNAEGSKGNTREATDYCHIIVMPYGDRNLDTIFRSERPDMVTVRKLMKEVGEALADLHDKNVVHGDLKMLNVVRIHGHLKLIDLDASCSIDKDEYLGAKFSSGVLPPEMIYCYKPYEETEQIIEYYKDENEDEQKKREPKFTKRKGTKQGYVVRSFLTEEEVKTEVDPETGYNIPEIKHVPKEGLPFDKGLVKAAKSADIWAFGILMYTLCKGGTMFKVNRDDDLDDGDSMERLYDWKSFSDRKIRDKFAKALLTKILMKNATERPSIGEILDDGFFHPEKQSDLAEVLAKLEVIEGLTSNHKNELLQMQEVLLRGIFEATEVNTPTTFVILQEKLPSKAEVEGLNQKLLKIRLKEDGTGFDCDGELGEKVKKVKERFDEGQKWLHRLVDIASQTVSGDIDSAFVEIKKCLGDLVTAKTMYFYLVDELTGEPVQAKGYPLEITTPSELVPKLVPYMQFGLRAMSLCNGVAGIANMFHPGIPKIPRAWQKGAHKSLTVLKQESSVEQYGAVHSALQGDEKSNCLRGASLRELQRFLKDKDKGDDWAGLRRIGDKDGYACWTALDKGLVGDALEKRAQQRRDEMAREERQQSEEEQTRAQKAEKELEEMKEKLQQAEAQARCVEEKLEEMEAVKTRAQKAEEELEEMKGKLQQAQQNEAQAQQVEPPAQQQAGTCTCKCIIQ